MDAEPWSAPATLGPHRHVDLRIVVSREEVPDDSRRAMAHGRVRSTRQHRSHFPREWQECQVPDGVHAAMKPVEVVLAQARVNRTSADSHREELLP